MLSLCLEIKSRLAKYPTINFPLNQCIFSPTCWPQVLSFTHRKKVQGPYSPTVLKNILCLFLQDFVNVNVTQLLIGYTVWISQSEVVLHSNAANIENYGEHDQEHSEE